MINKTLSVTLFLTAAMIATAGVYCGEPYQPSLVSTGGLVSPPGVVPSGDAGQPGTTTAPVFTCTNDVWAPGGCNTAPPAYYECVTAVAPLTYNTYIPVVNKNTPPQNPNETFYYDCGCYKGTSKENLVYGYTPLSGDQPLGCPQ